MNAPQPDFESRLTVTSKSGATAPAVKYAVAASLVPRMSGTGVLRM